jgi:hypothetical protein
MWKGIFTVLCALLVGVALCISTIAIADESTTMSNNSETYFKASQCSCPEWFYIAYVPNEELTILGRLKKIRHKERLIFCLSEEDDDSSKIKGCI